MPPLFQRAPADSYRILRIMLVRTVMAVCGLAALAATGPTAQIHEPLYTCVDGAATLTLDIGITVCDAAPTEALNRRLDEDHLQRRPGALVTEIADGGVAQAAGLQPDDVIYRVGGINVDSKVTTNTRLNLVEENADTVVNFLRDGRPYLVRVRKP